VVRVGEFIGDDALEVVAADRLVKCTAFANNTVGERDPSFGAFADWGKMNSTLRGPQSGTRPWLPG